MRERVALLNGTFSIESTRGQGTTLCVSFKTRINTHLLATNHLEYDFNICARIAMSDDLIDARCGKP